MATEAQAITTYDVISYISRLEAEKQILEEKLKVQRENYVDTALFDKVTLTVGEVAKLHGVSTARVRDYAKRGLIGLHPNSTDAKMLFWASAALKFDFRTLRREKSLLKR